MSARTLDYLDTVSHLPEGSTLLIHDVGWGDYECLLDDLARGSHRRVSYDRGRLQIMTPLPEHETAARLIDVLVRIYAEERGLDVESFGSTTWKRQSIAKGVEPGSCYYITNAAHVISLRHHIDLESDPPPDVAVEIDLTNESLGKFGIYAALMVPEIWRYDAAAFHFYELSAGDYHPVAESRALAGLTPMMLTVAMEQSKTDGQSASLRGFRARLMPPAR